MELEVHSLPNEAAGRGAIPNGGGWDLMGGPFDGARMAVVNNESNKSALVVVNAGRTIGQYLPRPGTDKLDWIWRKPT